MDLDNQRLPGGASYSMDAWRYGGQCDHRALLLELVAPCVLWHPTCRYPMGTSVVGTKHIPGQGLDDSKHGTGGMPQ